MEKEIYFCSVLSFSDFSYSTLDAAKLVAPSVLFLESQNGAISIGKIATWDWDKFFFYYSDQESSWTLL